jgi:hypothetical protein
MESLKLSIFTVSHQKEAKTKNTKIALINTLKDNYPLRVKEKIKNRNFSVL